MKKNGFFLNDRLNDTQIERFLLFEDEELIFATREHWLPLVFRAVKHTFLSILLAATAAIILFVGASSISVSISVFFLILLIGSMVIIRDLIHWSFHLYIATNKQIIEIHYSPLLSEAINSILLDQIRCTEIDVDMFGFIPEILGIGNVELTFDRPTHKEQFIIHGIRSPRTIAKLLSAQIHQVVPNGLTPVTKPLWIRELKKNKYRFLGDTPYGYITS